MGYEAVLGFNTKQWWVYSSDLDLYIDVPIEVLDRIKKVPRRKDGFRDTEAEQKLLEEIINENPSWLQDKDYMYDGEI